MIFFEIVVLEWWSSRELENLKATIENLYYKCRQEEGSESWLDKKSEAETKNVNGNEVEISQEKLPSTLPNVLLET